MLNPTPATIYLKDYTPPSFLIARVDLDIDLRDDHTVVKARLEVARNPAARDARAPLELDGDEIELLSVALDGKRLAAGDFTADDSRLTIPAVPERFVLETSVRLLPKQNTKLMGLYASRDGYFTQCEAEGFRRITWFIDRPDVMSRYTTTIHADRDTYPFLLSNGNLADKGEEAGG
jgi:aminopeptidase N